MTHRAALRWLERATKELSPDATVSILDVACGHGDLLRAIAQWARNRGLKVRLSGIDLNPRSAATARAATPAWMGIDYRTADVFSYQPPGRPDFIVSSQFAHHLCDGDIVKFLRWLDENSRRGWHIADLHRHPLPYYTFPILCRAAGWHRIVREDGRISIARSFHRCEWRGYLHDAGVRANICWQIPFRFCISSIKTAW